MRADLSPQAGRGEGNTASRSRRAFRPSFANNVRPSPNRGRMRSQEGRREDRMRAAPAVSRAKAEEKAHTSIQVQRKQSGLPCAMVLRLIRDLPGDRLFVTIISEKLVSQKLDASTGASEPHDFAVRFSAVRQRRLRVHRIPPHVRDDRETPSYGAGWLGISR